MSAPFSTSSCAISTEQSAAAIISGVYPSCAPQRRGALQSDLPHLVGRVQVDSAPHEQRRGVHVETAGRLEQRKRALLLPSPPLQQRAHRLEAARPHRLRQHERTHTRRRLAMTRDTGDGGRACKSFVSEECAYLTLGWTCTYVRYVWKKKKKRKKWQFMHILLHIVLYVLYIHCARKCYIYRRAE